MRAVVRKERVYGDDLVGIRDGWRGAIEGDLGPVSVESFRGDAASGWTILGSSLMNPYKQDGGPEAVKATLADHGIDALVAIGEEDTLKASPRGWRARGWRSSACRRPSTTTCRPPS